MSRATERAVRAAAGGHRSDHSHHDQHGGHRGNKAALPSKPCQACGLPMSWRRAWAKNWAQVRYCSERCRRRGAAWPAASP